MKNVITIEDFRDLLKESAEKAGSVRALAAGIGVSASFLWNVINGIKPPGPKVLDYTGYEVVDSPVMLRRKEKHDVTVQT